ncbi:FAD-dependent 5-carboxymethylaminomethyl-2-thiouridine(34) oxidoreductase MnmC [Shewanella algicola]|uniref:tRNA 5-methylaminomethyl-2-thiouridine biosynthesis bifunctional protein MnmC n=1 Tax=Shewanella algicola TaxID=640633 RepID=A0A9X1ZI41_9GAMM|nr:FAD-dependent 5-carboxymethylaminomethyl-2-thiouridine(34) oxidoreductase MnmC [Shewanella algicola]MCL1107323.1 FAD-dependent 5-carboxymethylaminomethyl-2-thiouridine(34) oxidoreductase MnmC [Shewanella algicola]
MSKSTLLSVSNTQQPLLTHQLLGDNGDNQYYQSVQQYIDTVLQTRDGQITAHNKGNLVTLGQLGIADAHEILLLQAAVHKTPQLSVHLVVIAHQAINRQQLQKQWQQQGLLHAKHPLMPHANALLNTELAAIDGCQRLTLNNTRLIIDVYYGEPIKQLKLVATPGKQRIQHWLALPDTSQSNQIDHYFNQTVLWQYARLSSDNASFYRASKTTNADTSQKAIDKQLTLCGFNTLLVEPVDDITMAERQAMRQQLNQQFAYNPLPSTSEKDDAIAIIGGGIAAASLALSLAQRGKSSILYCKDAQLGQGASGNKQGAIYPLLTPENGPLSQFFQQAFLFSRRQIQSLVDDGFIIGHQWCGVLHTGFDERSETRLNKIIKGQHWPAEIATTVNAKQASQLANLNIDKSGFYYPLGGWVCPFEFAQAAISKAQTLANVTVVYNSQIKRMESSQQGWQLYTDNAELPIATHPQLVVASGAQLTDYPQTKQLQITGFRGQVSHVPAQGELANLSTVICANGYLTPQHQQLHCVGASYVKDPKHLDFCPQEQHENSLKMKQSFPNSNWPNDIDVSNNDARVGVRMVSRDHFPVMGSATDVEELFNRYAIQQQSKDKPSQWQRYWQTTPAPIYEGLYVLGGLGSRGLSSGPLVAECLAANLCGELSPLNLELQALLSPNRMWLRKLLKGKALM